MGEGGLVFICRLAECQPTKGPAALSPFPHPPQRNIYLMPKALAQPQETFASHLRSLVDTAEVLRLINDITTCTVEWEDQPGPVAEPARGLELFPCFRLYFHRHLMEVKGFIYPNIPNGDGPGVSHLIRLELAGAPLHLRLSTQTAFLLSPFHSRFLSMLFGRLVLHYLSVTPDGGGLLPFTPYSLEEQVVAGYLLSLDWAPCATIKLDAQDNPYIGSMLHSEADLRRCEMPGGAREEAVIRGWRLFKRLLYYSVEGERLYTGFAIMPGTRPLEHYLQHYPNLILYDPSNHISMDEGLQALRQLLLNADGRSTFLAVYGGRIIGLLEILHGTQRQLTSGKAWRSTLPLASITSRGRVSFWFPLRGRRNPVIPLSVLEYRHGHLHIPLFQDIFWQELERQLKEVCPDCYVPAALPRLKTLLEMLRRSGHGGIFLIGLTAAELADPHTPLENPVRLAQPVPLQDRWLRHLLGMAKSDGAMIFNDHLEACQFRARVRATPVCLLPEKDDLGSGMRHQVTREFSAYCPTVLGICISQDGHISLYRQGKLISRLY